MECGKWSQNGSSLVVAGRRYEHGDTTGARVPVATSLCVWSAATATQVVGVVPIRWLSDPIRGDMAVIDLHGAHDVCAIAHFVCLHKLALAICCPPATRHHRSDIDLLTSVQVRIVL